MQARIKGIATIKKIKMPSPPLSLSLSLQPHAAMVSAQVLLVLDGLSISRSVYPKVRSSNLELYFKRRSERMRYCKLWKSVGEGQRWRRKRKNWTMRS